MATEQQKAAVFLSVTIAAFGAAGFAFWMGSFGAGLWCLAVELLLMDAVSEIEQAIRRSPK